MTLAQTGFIILSAIALGGALAAVTLRNITHAVLSLILFFFGIAGLYFLLRADFIGVVQILVYVGAVAVLIAFAIVLTWQTEGEQDWQELGGKWFVGSLAAALVGGILVGVILRSERVAVLVETVPVGSVEQIGRALMTEYVLPFEIVSILLTAALIAAVVIAMEEIKKRASRR